MQCYKNEGLWKNMCVKAVKEALNLIKAVGLSDITSELLKVCKNKTAKKLAEVADDLPQRKEMPES